MSNAVACTSSLGKENEMHFATILLKYSERYLGKCQMICRLTARNPFADGNGAFLDVRCGC